MRASGGAWAVLVVIGLVAISWPVAAGGGFSGGGGPFIVGVFFDLGELERSLQGIVRIQGDLDLGDQSLFLLRGGGGLGGPEFRFGGMGMQGEWTYPVTGESEFDRMTLTVGGGGFLMDRLIGETEDAGFSLGAVVGGGEWTLRMNKDAQGSFGEIVRQPVSLELHRSFWFALPYASVEFRIFEFVGIRAGAGFWATLSFDDWKIPGGPVAPGGPLRSTLSPLLQLMLIFGG